MKRMLINATQPEELRVAMVDGQNLYDLDIEVRGHGQKKANIYKGRVSRVEPSLEACFVEYGAERHGFLPLREIAPSYHHAAADSGSRLAIKDAIKEGQEVIVQVEKEERGTKGAALTTYVSLAGRYLVLMPNNPSAGGVSSRIEGADRDEIRGILSELPIPKGTGVIVRTAGCGRSLEQLKWDLDYLMSVWEAIGQAATKPAPFLIYQESNVIIRALRDHFTGDIGEVIFDDMHMLEEARAFVEMVMPQHLSRLKFYEDRMPLFTRFQIESQIDAAYQRQVRLPSGGAVVLDQTEALVAVDVNSARATQGSDINETALNTNLEAADEVARQLRIRDIGGLIVVDFIDMSSSRHIREVEQRLHQALAMDRARIQVGRISRFGLLEMSRQRLRPALSDAVFERCPRCTGKGMIRSVESLTLSVLRLIQEEAIKDRTARVTAEVPVEVATYLMNEKRAALVETETRCGINIVIVPNPHMDTPHYKVERIRDDQLGEHEKPSHSLVETPDSPVMPERPAPAEAAAVSALRPPAPPPAPVVKAKSVARSGWFARLLARLGAAKGVEEKKTSAKPAAAHSNNRGRRPAAGSGARNNPRSRSTTGGTRAPRGNAQRGNSNRRKSGGNSSASAADKNGSEKETKPAPSRNTNVRKDSKPDAAQAEPKPDTTPKPETTGNEATQEGGTRPRTRRGRRGGRRHRGGRSGGANARTDDENRNEANATSAVNDAAPNAAPAQTERRTADSEPSREAPREQTPTEVRRETPPVAETPRLAALYEREQTDSGKSDN
ncbi:MAG: Rne/Rng family ribonuclease [Gammaproteobacteria bacterium]